MLPYDRSMVEGQPLRYYYDFDYYNYYSPKEAPLRPPEGVLDKKDSFLFFHTMDDYLNKDAKEDLNVSCSYSSQSDSEGSVSSVEVSSRTIKQKQSETVCRWQGCGTRCDSLDSLAGHVAKTHSAQGPGGLFYCKWESCSRNSKGFNARYKMLVHVRTHTNEKPHRCSLCSKSFSRAENLKIHLRSHSGEKPYVCPVLGCGKAYSNSSDRFKHTRTHQVDKPYACKIPGCSKRYTDPSSLRKHVKTYKHALAENRLPEVLPAAPVGLQMEERLSDSCIMGPHGRIMELGALINPKRPGDLEGVRWNGYVGAYMKQELMDVEVPLDLSVQSKRVV